MVRAVYRNFAGGRGQILGTYKRGGGGGGEAYYEVLHPILAREGARMTQGGGGEFGVRMRGGGGGNLGYVQKRGGGGRSLYEVLHPIVARGGARMPQGGANAFPPLKYSPDGRLAQNPMVMSFS